MEKKPAPTERSDAISIGGIRLEIPRIDYAARAKNLSRRVPRVLRNVFRECGLSWDSFLEVWKDRLALGRVHEKRIWRLLVTAT